MGLFRKFRSFTAEWGWEEIVPSSGSEPSGARLNPVFTRNGTAGNFALAGGQSGWSDLWTFNLSTKTWTQVVASGAFSGPGAGYADGNGNLLIAAKNDWDSTASNVSFKISLTTGAVVALTSSGAAGGSGARCFAVDAASQKLYMSIAGSTNYYVGDGASNGLLTVQQDVSNNTSTRTALSVGGSSPRTNFLQSSSLALYPAGNTLYMLGPQVSYLSSWSLNSSSIIKYDITAATGWAQESGVTNNVGAVPMPFFSRNATQLVWCSAENKFFIFVASDDANYSCARVLTYDPASKVLAESLFDGVAPLYILGATDAYSSQRGNVGAVVVSGSDFYFCRAASSGVTNARIWKFRRN